ncbi:MAG: hypB [Paenibacillus sp.]|jgi:hydrogenase nickel incorporation protein HypB|uniref:hydrogenase nickel incorporation protein HypB n=1 Tax=Paenibacillus sp. GCM10012303 TaxID=3317340 RepID=UPI0029EC5E4C|nr:hypB [Paenibacillus sp.]
MVIRVAVEQEIFRGNREWAMRNRAMLQMHQVCAVNLMSSPGAGKTSVLERAIPQLAVRLRTVVIEGDVMTALDAERIAVLGIPAVQINTRGACHLDAKMIHDVLVKLPLAEIDLLLIENVGNLVCPADFELGEQLRVTVLSVTEGEDKVEKYPYIFRKADAVLLNKTDLLPYVPFDVPRFRKELWQANPDVEVIHTSASTGEGIDSWTDWLIRRANFIPQKSESDSK